jgi:signal transduction histidine kinase
MSVRRLLPPTPKGFSLAFKLVARVTLFSLLFTLVLTASMAVVRHHQLRTESLNEIRFIASTYSKSLASSLWDLDLSNTQLQIESLTQFPIIAHAVLISNTGQRLHQHKKSAHPHGDTHTDAISWKESLFSPVNQKKEIGQLIIYIDENQLFETTKKDALHLLGGELIKGILLSMLLTWLMSRIVTRHIAHLAAHTAKLRPDTLDQPIILNRSINTYPDELDQLCMAFNKLHYDLVEYNRREELLAEKMMQEKVAALGFLVAGIAHELNTPLGNSLVMTSVLEENTNTLSEKLENGAISKQLLIEFIGDTQEAARLIMRGLKTSSRLVSTFKQVAVDRASAQFRTFDLLDTCNEIIATMNVALCAGEHQIEVDIPNDITISSYPGPFGQVISNLIDNAILHAFDGNTGGQMRLCAQVDESGHVQIEFADNGKGIEEQNLNRIFDPFFTTKMGQGGSGLGLSISYNIVTTLLNGQINVRSQIGQGTVFCLDLPLVIKAHNAL